MWCTIFVAVEISGTMALDQSQNQDSVWRLGLFNRNTPLLFLAVRDYRSRTPWLPQKGYPWSSHPW